MRWWDGVCNCQHFLSPLPKVYSGATSIIWFGGEAVYLGGKRLNMASLPLKCSSSLQSLKQQHTPEIYEPEWHLSFGVVWMGAEHSPASLSQKAFLDFSWLFSARVIFQKPLCLRRQLFLFIPFFAQWRTWCICIRRRGSLLGSVKYWLLHWLRCKFNIVLVWAVWLPYYGRVAKRCQLWVCTIDWWKRE